MGRGHTFTLAFDVCSVLCSWKNTSRRWRRIFLALRKVAMYTLWCRGKSPRAYQTRSRTFGVSLFLLTKRCDSLAASAYFSCFSLPLGFRRWIIFYLWLAKCSSAFSFAIYESILMASGDREPDLSSWIKLSRCQPSVSFVLIFHRLLACASEPIVLIQFRCRETTF